MTVIEQRPRGGDRSAQIRLGHDHHAVRQQCARDCSDLMPGGEARLGTFILLGYIAAMDR
ncbi:hypothetical protein [uncultured Sphingomonas sp.]|uniref:hypothetical protein n=1 Tax=uncultured Sphingomonas sp. TaxID=158754 RepID=UPI0035CB3BC8